MHRLKLPGHENCEIIETDHGMGLAATRASKSATVRNPQYVCDYGGTEVRVLPGENIQEVPLTQLKYGCEFTDRTQVIRKFPGAVLDGLAYFANATTTPEKANAILVQSGRTVKLYLVAPILPGEQYLICYGPHYWKIFWRDLDTVSQGQLIERFPDERFPPTTVWEINAQIYEDVNEAEVRYAIESNNIFEELSAKTEEAPAPVQWVPAAPGLVQPLMHQFVTMDSALVGWSPKSMGAHSEAMPDMICVLIPLLCATLRAHQWQLSRSRVRQHLVDVLQTGSEADLLAEVYQTSVCSESQILDLLHTTDDDPQCHQPIPEGLLRTAIDASIKQSKAIADRQPEIDNILIVTHRDELTEEAISTDTQFIVCYAKGQYWIWVRNENRVALREAVEAHSKPKPKAKPKTLQSRPKPKVKTKHIYTKEEQMAFKRHWRVNQDKAQPVSEIPEQDNNVELTTGDNNDMNDNDNDIDNHIYDINNVDVEGKQRAPKRKHMTIDNTRVQRNAVATAQQGELQYHMNETTTSGQHSLKRAKKDNKSNREDDMID
jgi:hypothetical protein